MSMKYLRNDSKLILWNMFQQNFEFSCLGTCFRPILEHLGFRFFVRFRPGAQGIPEAYCTKNHYSIYRDPLILTSSNTGNRTKAAPVI